ncbi:F-box protein [Hordeum vulgare]|nr:F-box protein [Hordeum vulgare]
MSWTAGAVSLPDEIIFDILTRVPVNSACRFRCVSREWDALISDPDFVAAHKSRHAEPLVAVYSFREEPSKGTELRLVDMDGNAVRVIKVKDGGGSSSSRLPRHDLICVTDDHSGACLVDPVTGDLLVTCPCPRTTNAEFVMCFGRAVPSGAYKCVVLLPRRMVPPCSCSNRWPRMETDAAVPNPCRVLPGLRGRREWNPPYLGDGWGPWG